MQSAIFRNEVRSLVEEQGAQLVDVLPREEYEDDHLPKATNLPLKELDRETITRRRPTNWGGYFLPGSSPTGSKYGFADS